MIDCSKTENYFAEKRRMTKRAEKGLYYLGLISRDDCRKDHNCVKCWNQPISIEDGEE
jgi:uncharacterized Fe-S cluster-containing radical SAM superfamily protein